MVLSYMALELALSGICYRSGLLHSESRHSKLEGPFGRQQTQSSGSLSDPLHGWFEVDRPHLISPGRGDE